MVKKCFTDNGLGLCQALPCCKAPPGSEEHDSKQTLIWLEHDAICHRMRRRKNRSQGSGTLMRVCSCQGSTHLCAVHVLWDRFFAELPEGAMPWQNVSPSYARDRLRALLRSLSVPHAEAYGTQDFRRGHAEVSVALRHMLKLTILAYVWQDMRKCGCTLSEISPSGAVEVGCVHDVH